MLVHRDVAADQLGVTVSTLPKEIRPHIEALRWRWRLVGADMDEPHAQRAAADPRRPRNRWPKPFMRGRRLYKQASSVWAERPPRLPIGTAYRNRHGHAPGERLGALEAISIDRLLVLAAKALYPDALPPALPTEVSSLDRSRMSYPASAQSSPAADTHLSQRQTARDHRGSGTAVSIRPGPGELRYRGGIGCFAPLRYRPDHACSARPGRTSAWRANARQWLANAGRLEELLFVRGDGRTYDRPNRPGATAICPSAVAAFVDCT